MVKRALSWLKQIPFGSPFYTEFSNASQKYAFCQLSYPIASPISSPISPHLQLSPTTWFSANVRKNLSWLSWQYQAKFLKISWQFPSWKFKIVNQIDWTTQDCELVLYCAGNCLQKRSSGTSIMVLKRFNPAPPSQWSPPLRGVD